MKAGIVAIVSGLLWASTTSGNSNDNIHFDKELIPCLDEQFPNLPIYTLDPPTIFPADKFDEILGCAAPGITLNRTQTENGVLVYDGDRLVGFVDYNTGESTIFPQIGALNPADDIQVGRIHEFLSDYTIFPHDDITFTPVNGSTLSGSTKNTTTDATPPAAYLKDVYIDRIVSYGDRQFPSCGEGNKAFFSFGSEGKIYSLTHRWRATRRSYSTVTPLPREKIYNLIKDQLCTFGEGSTITVTAVDVCFYESGVSFMQPVYRFYATLDDGNPDTLPQSVVGYAAVGDSPPEPVPVFTGLDGQVLPGPADNSTELLQRGIISKRAKQINVGRYVARNDSLAPRWVEDANYLLGGLLKPGPVNFNFINSQYYWAQPFVYTTSKNSFINSVQLAYTVGHGSPHSIYTNGLLPNKGRVDISADIGIDGYGPGSNGSLAYWIIKGCNVTLSPDDVSFNAAFDPWWNVFNGLHAIMSYRTFSWSSDAGEGNDVGSAIASGASVLFAWMKGVNQHNNGGREKASAVTVCGHADDTLWQTENIGRPGCLQIWWYKD